MEFLLLVLLGSVPVAVGINRAWAGDNPVGWAVLSALGAFFSVAVIDAGLSLELWAHCGSHSADVFLFILCLAAYSGGWFGPIVGLGIFLGTISHRLLPPPAGIRSPREDWVGPNSVAEDRPRNEHNDRPDGAWHTPLSAVPPAGLSGRSELERKTVAELREIARTHGIKPSRLRKSELIEAIENTTTAEATRS